MEIDEIVWKPMARSSNWMGASKTIWNYQKGIWYNHIADVDWSLLLGVIFITKLEAVRTSFSGDIGATIPLIPTKSVFPIIVAYRRIVAYPNIGRFSLTALSQYLMGSCLSTDSSGISPLWCYSCDCCRCLSQTCSVAKSVLQVSRPF